MRVFACNDHDGLWVGTASVVVAADEASARVLLDAELVSRHLLPGPLSSYTLQEVSVAEPKVIVLQDGDY